MPTLLLREPVGAEPHVEMKRWIARETGGKVAQDELHAVQFSGSGNPFFEMALESGPGRVEVALRSATREREARNAELLEKSPGGFGVPAPRLLARGRFGSWPYVVEERLDGVSFLEVARSGDPSRTAAARRSAVEILIRMASVSPDPTGFRARAERLDRLLASVESLERASRRPAVGGSLDSLGVWCRKELERWNPSLPLVVSHGDFGPQNILVDGETGRVTGVVDWDLAEEWGFPLVDLAHLRAALRWKLGEGTLPDAIRDSLSFRDPVWFDDVENRPYRERVEVPREAVPFLDVVTWIEWVAPHAQTERSRDRAWVEENVTGFVDSEEVQGLVMGESGE